MIGEGAQHHRPRRTNHREGAQHDSPRRTGDRGRCNQTRSDMTAETAQVAALMRGKREYRADAAARGSLQGAREPGKPPTARVPGSPEPSGPSSRPEGALRAPPATHIPRRPSTRGNRHSAAPTPPATARTGPRGNNPGTAKRSAP